MVHDGSDAASNKPVFLPHIMLRRILLDHLALQPEKTQRLMWLMAAQAATILTCRTSDNRRHRIARTMRDRLRLHRRASHEFERARDRAKSNRR